MMADGRLCHIKMCGDLPGGKIPLRQQFQDAPPGRIGQGFECIAQNGTLLSGEIRSFLECVLRPVPQPEDRGVQDTTRELLKSTETLNTVR